MLTESPRIFISYSHDSAEHKERVLALANRLRHDGIDAHLDQYEEAPPEGWPRWMDLQIAEAEFVLLVCTETYHERVMMRTPKGKGHGVLWESNLIYQYLYEAGTVNATFIPVLPPDGKSDHIPTALRPFQRYEPFTEDGYWELYRRLTRQPRTSRPPLGKRKALLPDELTRHEAASPRPVSVACSSSPRAVLFSESQKLQAFIPVKESQWDDQKATFIFEPDIPDDGAFLDSLRGFRTPLFVAYRNSAGMVDVERVEHHTNSGVDRWRLTVRIRQADFTNGMEMNTTDLTADDAATLRARRVLLNDNPTDPKRGIDQILREIIISGQGTGIEVRGSPFPTLYKALGHDPQVFIESAWIFAVFLLKVSAAIEHVTTFTLELVGEELRIQFSGRRAKRYTNQPAFTVEVSGTCVL
jgi:hypothetical protein